MTTKLAKIHNGVRVGSIEPVRLSEIPGELHVLVVTDDGEKLMLASHARLRHGECRVETQYRDGRQTLEWVVFPARTKM